MKQRAAALLFLWTFGIHAGAQAQFHRATDPVATPASSLLRQDDAAAIDVNPGSLGLLPAWSLVYVHAQLAERGGWLGQGDQVSLATPLLFGLSLGATLQSLRPLAASARPALERNDRAALGLSLAYALGSRFGLGATARGFYSRDSAIDGLTAFDLGAAWRANHWLGFSLVGRDLFASRRGFGTAGLDLGASLVGGVKVRPAGDSSFLFTLDMGIDASRRVGGRVGFGFKVPYLGYASSLLELERIGRKEHAYRAMLEVNASFEGLTVGGGVLGGDALTSGVGGYGLARLEGQVRPGIPTCPRVLDVELSNSSETGMLATLLTLESALHDDRVSGVLLRPRGSSLGSAYAQEVRMLVSALRKAGKRVACHLEEATGSQYYACAGADEILLDPAGNLRLLGIASDVLLYGDTLKKIGLRADFLRIGEYKSAPEAYTQGQLSEPARAELRTLLSDVHARLLQDLSKDLHVEPAQVAAIMDDGPHLTQQALKAKLVSGAVGEAELKQGEGETFKGKSVVASLPGKVREDWGVGPRVGVVMIDGSIVDGENVDLPILGIHMTGGNTAVAALDAMTGDPMVRAIVLRVDSPGGAVLASEQIWRAVRRAKAVKPVVVSMGAVAASGGYYAAAAGTEIWASPSTLTGSIGIFTGKIDGAQLAEMLGVGVEQFRFGKRAAGESLFQPFTPDERATLADRMRSYYRLFLARVATGRGLTMERVDALGRGRVYSGDTALRLGLIDHLGGFSSALARARQLGHLDARAGVVVLPKRPNTLLDYIAPELSGASVQAPNLVELLPAEVRSALVRAAVMERLGAATPLALLPYEVRY